MQTCLLSQTSCVCFLPRTPLLGYLLTPSLNLRLSNTTVADTPTRTNIATNTTDSLLTLTQEHLMYQVYSGPTIQVCLLTLTGFDTQP